MAPGETIGTLMAKCPKSQHNGGDVIQSKRARILMSVVGVLVFSVLALGSGDDSSDYVSDCQKLCMATVKAGYARESDCSECSNSTCAKCVVGAASSSSGQVSSDMVFIPASTYCTVERGVCP